MGSSLNATRNSLSPQNLKPGNLLGKTKESTTSYLYGNCGSFNQPQHNIHRYRPPSQTHHPPNTHSTPNNRDKNLHHLSMHSLQKDVSDESRGKQKCLILT